jgi:hypothetical protein
MSAGTIEWSHDPEFWSATAAEHAFVGPYELVAFDIPPSDQFPARDIGWELFGGEKFMSQLAKGKAASFDSTGCCESCRRDHLTVELKINRGS